jgi:FdhE protein
VQQPRERTSRSEPREVAELRQVKERQPELAPAVDLQVALIELQRRVQARVPMPWIEFAPDWLRTQQAAGRPLLRFEEIPLDWTDVRLVFRQTADVLRRHEGLEPADYVALQALGRDGHALEPLVADWFNRTAHPDQAGAPPALPVAVSAEALDQVLALTLRPFLERCAEAVRQRVDFSGWRLASCPLCGGEAELAALDAKGDRFLICGRCTTEWRFDRGVCPFCRNDDRGRLPSFASRDGLYRLDACDVCRRYLKSFDTRAGHRHALLAVDSIATLPLDAAALQRGYQG